MDHAYWGPQFSDEEIGGLLAAKKAEIAAQGCVVNRLENEAALGSRTAKAIAEGKVVGWFQGRMEWGPRALGNRSIVCDPRRVTVPGKLSDDLAPGTLNSILKQAGLKK